MGIRGATHLSALAALMVSLAGAAIAGDTPAPAAGIAPPFQGVWTIHEVQLLIVVDKDVLQLYGYGANAVPNPDPQSGMKTLDAAQRAKDMRPLLAEVTAANTTAKLVEALRTELAGAGVKVMGVTILPGAGSMLDRQKLAASQELLPRAYASLVVVPNITLSADYRRLLIFDTDWVCSRDSNEALSTAGGSARSDPLEGPDPVAQWSADHGARFFQELAGQESSIARGIAASFRRGYPGAE